MSKDVIQLSRSAEYTMDRVPFKFGGLFGVFGSAQKGAREDDDGTCSDIKIEGR